jgi:hypothetical protein
MIIAYLNNENSIGTFCELLLAKQYNKRIIVFINNKFIGVNDNYEISNYPELDNKFWYLIASLKLNKNNVFYVNNINDIQKKLRDIFRLKLDKDSYKEYLCSFHWKEKRKEAINFYGNKCSICGSYRKINVHHKSYTNLGHEPLEDLVVLCHTCHEKVHKEHIKL